MKVKDFIEAYSEALDREIKIQEGQSERLYEQASMFEPEIREMYYQQERFVTTYLNGLYRAKSILEEIIHESTNS